MKLHEIIKVSQQMEHGLDLPYWDNAKQFRQAKVENYPLLANITGDDYFFCIEDPTTGKKFAFVKAVKVDGLQKDALTIKRTWLDKAYRNKGFMTALYNTLHNQGFSLISDYNTTVLRNILFLTQN